MQGNCSGPAPAFEELPSMEAVQPGQCVLSTDKLVFVGGLSPSRSEGLWISNLYLRAVTVGDFETLIAFNASSPLNVWVEDVTFQGRGKTSTNWLRGAGVWSSAIRARFTRAPSH